MLLAVELRATLVGWREQLMPVGVDTDRLMVPEKPERLFRLIVAVPVDPASVVMEFVLALMVKSCAMIVTLAGWVKEPLVPVTVTP
jgi:hypothetical protein